MRLSHTALAFAVIAVASASSAFAVTERFETGLSGNGAGQSAPGVTLALQSGNWHALNASSPVGTTGVFSQGGPNAPFPAHEGNLYAGFNYNSTAGAGDISSYLMSPEISIVGGDTVSFWTRTVTNPSFPDRLEFVLSLDGASTLASSFTTVLLSINRTLTTSGFPTVWTEYTVTLPQVPANSTGRFAFHYSVPNGGPSGNNSDYIGIDTVTFNAAAIPEPAALGLLAPAGLLLSRRRKA